MRSSPLDSECRPWYVESMAAVIEVQNLVKTYPGVRAVDNVSLAIEQGVCFGLLGPNGAGKTTLIEIVEGIQRFDSGRTLYKGAPWATASGGRQASSSRSPRSRSS